MKKLTEKIGEIFKIIKNPNLNFYFKSIINETLEDIIFIKYLKENLEEFYPDYPLIRSLEKNENIELYEIMKRKYKERYCPSFLFDNLTSSQKTQYLMLRIEIDKLLEIKDTKYQI